MQYTLAKLIPSIKFSSRTRQDRRRLQLLFFHFGDINHGLFINQALFFLFAEGQVTGRGCSTKDKVFYKECETHSYGEQVEKMCFCSYFLCNLSTAVAPPSCLLLLIIGASLCVLNESHCQTTTCSHDYRTIDIDICDNIIALANGKKEETASISEKTTPKSCQHLLLQRTIKSSRAVS